VAPATASVPNTTFRPGVASAFRTAPTAGGIALSMAANPASL
jgi:hypothetical protein